MPEQFEQINPEINGVDLGKINPGDVEVPKPAELTTEEDKGLLDVLQRAKEAEKADDYQTATVLYEQYQAEYKRIKQEKLGGELGEKFALDEQYKAQIKILETAGILQEFSDGIKGIIGIDGKEYPVPSLEKILSAIIPEKAELLAKKKEQGFTKLLITPFAMPLSELKERYKVLLLKKDSEGTLLATDGSKLALDRNEPVWAWDGYEQADINGNLVYEPKKFDNDHEGKTKQEIINQSNPWKIKLIEDMPDLPAFGDGKMIGGRSQHEANFTPNHYLNTPNMNTVYEGEKGFDPETWLTYAITNLEEKNQQIDDWQGQGKSCFLVGAYFPGSGDVPLARWYRGDRQAYLGGRVPSYSSSDVGCRSSVEIQ